MESTQCKYPPCSRFSIHSTYRITSAVRSSPLSQGHCHLPTTMNALMTLKTHLSLEGESVSDWQREYQMLMGKEQSSPTTEVEGRRWLSTRSWHVKGLIFLRNNSLPCPISHFRTSSFVLFTLHQGKKKLYNFMSIILFVLVGILNVYNPVTMIF